MTTPRVVRTLSSIATMFAASPALAQMAPPSSTPMMPAPDPGAVQSGGWIMAAVLVIGLVVVVGALVKMFDLRRKRESEAVHLQAQISDALLREPNLFGLPITPTAHAPLWSGTPMTIELTGEVPDVAVRDSVLRVTRSEAMRVRPDFEIEDHLTVRRAIRVA